MMMMKYKLAKNKLKKRKSFCSVVEDEGPTNISPPSTNIKKRMQPKRVSLSSITSGRYDAASVASISSDIIIGRPLVLESPVSTIKEFDSTTKKPTKLSPPSDIFFAPISASRRLNFETPTKTTPLAGRDWSVAAPPAPRPALVSPRDTPDSTAGPLFEEGKPQEQQVISPRFPPALYIPTSDEQAAATLLMFMKKDNDENTLRGPLLFTSPKMKRRRSSTISWSENLILDHEQDEASSEDNASEDNSSVYEEEPSKKRRKLQRSVSSRKLSANKKKRTAPREGTYTVSSLQAFEKSQPTSSSNNQNGTTSLAMPDDSQHLNSLHCFVRSDLLEVFAMDEHTKNKHRDDDSTPRVGFRCVHCGHLPRKEKEGASMSIFYPKSLGDIYRSVCTWQRIHFKACRHVPQELVERYDYLKEMDRTRGKKHHWINSAYKVGLRDLDENRGGIVWDDDSEVHPSSQQ